MTKILLVEDNPLNQDMLSRRLKRQGYEVMVAVDGAAAVSRAKAEQPDIVLMDMNIPIIDGWEATRRLKSDVQTQAIPVIALTAHAMVGDREKALAAGCDEYATKPVEFKQLLKTLRRFTASQAEQGQARTRPASSGPASEMAPPVISVPAPPARTQTASFNGANGHSSTSRANSTNGSANGVSSTNGHSANGRQSTVPKAAALPADPPATLLLVNDNEINREVLKAHLQRRGYTVVTANGAQTALDILQEFAIDLVLLDIMTSDTGNLETLQRIRDRYPKTALSVVMITANDSGDEIVQAFDAGVNDYVTKPINLAVVMARIKSQLEMLNATRQQPDAEPLGTAHQHRQPPEAQPHPGRSQPTGHSGPAPVATVTDLPRQPQNTAPQIPIYTPPAAAQTSALQRLRTAAPSSSALDPSAPPSSLAPKSTIRPATNPALTRPQSVPVDFNCEYAPGHIFFKTDFNRIQLSEGPSQTEHSLCFVETFSPIAALAESATPEISLDKLQLERLQSVFTTEISQLQTLSKSRKMLEVLDFSASIDATHAPAPSSLSVVPSFRWEQAYCKGHLLSEEFLPDQRMPRLETLRTLREILKMLLPFHARRIAHTALQPQHIWRCQEDGQIKLLDLGLSSRLRGYLAQQVPQSRKRFAYENDYMPIEQRLGQATLSSDIYAAGLVGLQMITGKSPAALSHILLSSAAPMEELMSSTPKLGQLFSKMLAQNSKQRYSSSLAAMKDVNALLLDI